MKSGPPGDATRRAAPAAHVLVGLQAAAGNRAVSQLVVQRKVGYEFETGWLVHGRRSPVVRDDPAPWRPLKKKDAVGHARHDGFKIEADEAGAGESEIEFIVHPPVEEDAAGLARLEDVMDQMTMFGQVLEAKAQTENARPFPLDEVTRDPLDTLWQVTPTPDGRLAAGPQVTSGLDLAGIESLARLSRRFQERDVLSPPLSAPVPAELEPTIESLSFSAAEIRDVWRGLPGPLRANDEPSSELVGLLVLVINYLGAGSNKHKGDELPRQTRFALALNYPKQIADSVLARTNMAALFKQVHLSERLYYKAHPDHWVGLVLSLVPRVADLREGTVTANDSVIARGVKEAEDDPQQRVVVPALTVKDWLEGIAAGTDLLPTVPHAESMGEFGMRTEKVGSGVFRRDVGIVELRGAQAQKIPLARWGPFATAFLRYVSGVHH